MKYSKFEQILSQDRLHRYLLACNNDTKKAMTLYRYNLRLSQELFTIISCFEVALRNAIDRQMVAILGSDWLRDAILPGGIFSGSKCRDTSKIISRSFNKLNTYKLLYCFIAEDFGLFGKIFSKTFPEALYCGAENIYFQTPNSISAMSLECVYKL